MDGVAPNFITIDASYNSSTLVLNINTPPPEIFQYVGGQKTLKIIAKSYWAMDMPGSVLNYFLTFRKTNKPPVI